MYERVNKRMNEERKKEATFQWRTNTQRKQLIRTYNFYTSVRYLSL